MRVEAIIDELCADIRALGTDGGRVSPSVYDTAQIVRLTSTTRRVMPALEWLVAQQQTDGGWGNPASPLTREVPTLACILALQKAAPDHASDSLEAALTFLKQQPPLWSDPLPDEMPVAVELLLPYLLDEVNAAGISVSSAPYRALVDFGHARRRSLQGTRVRAGTPSVYSWESWGRTPDPQLLDSWGSVGLSPSATAAWVHASRDCADLAADRATASHYLERAAAATTLGLPQVVGVSWPIDRFEQAFGLYALLLAGLLDYPPLQSVVTPQLDALAAAVSPVGIGFSDDFTADGDDTAVAFAVLNAGGYEVDWSILTAFSDDDHYCTWKGELHPAPSVTAHAVHALAGCGLPIDPAVSYLRALQRADGRWSSDKWHTSWLYTTAQAAIALHSVHSEAAVERSVQCVVEQQQRDGGWGMSGSTGEETAYALFMLRCAPRHAAYTSAYARGVRWLRAHVHDADGRKPSFWLSKEAFRPDRIVRVMERAALLRGILDEPDIT
jgi:hypothetical protein